MKKITLILFIIGIFLVSPAFALDYFPSPSCADHASTANGCTQALLNTIGTSKKATIVYEHKTSGINTTYTVERNADWSAYTNVTFKFAPGVLLSHGSYTLNIPTPEAG